MQSEKKEIYGYQGAVAEKEFDRQLASRGLNWPTWAHKELKHCLECIGIVQCNLSSQKSTWVHFQHVLFPPSPVKCRASDIALPAVLGSPLYQHAMQTNCCYKYQWEMQVARAKTNGFRKGNYFKKETSLLIQDCCITLVYNNNTFNFNTLSREAQRKREKGPVK